MQRVFITGGSGTVGSSFIERFSDKYKIYSFSRNETMQVSLKRLYPEVEIILGAVEDRSTLFRAIQKACPNIIIHSAALKHIDTAEHSPLTAVKSNVIGSLNVIEAAQEYGVANTVGISTDKACCADSNYGYTKSLMESMFLEAHSRRNRFCVCRFGNVSHSHGSVIPFWLGLRAENKPLPLTNRNMNRLMFSRAEAAELVYRAIIKSQSSDKNFIYSQLMKSVNMKKLADIISNDVKEVGLRDGEKLDEVLVSQKEAEYTFLEDGYITIKSYKNRKDNKLLHEYSSKNANFMTERELKSLVYDADEVLKKSLLKNRIY